MRIAGNAPRDRKLGLGEGEAGTDPLRLLPQRIPALPIDEIAAAAGDKHGFLERRSSIELHILEGRRRPGGEAAEQPSAFELPRGEYRLSGDAPEVHDLSVHQGLNQRA